MFKKRLALSLLTVATISMLVAGASFALFTAETSNAGNTITAGTVTLGTPVSTIANIANVAPGDSGSQSLAVTYTGNLNAWVGLDTIATGDLLTADGGKFELTISDGTKTYNNNAANQVVGLLANGDSRTFIVSWNLPLNTGNDAQGDSASVSLKVHAVQAKNNTNSTNDGPISWN